MPWHVRSTLHSISFKNSLQITLVMHKCSLLVGAVNAHAFCDYCSAQGISQAMTSELYIPVHAPVSNVTRNDRKRR